MFTITHWEIFPGNAYDNLGVEKSAQQNILHEIMFFRRAVNGIGGINGMSLPEYFAPNGESLQRLSDDTAQCLQETIRSRLNGIISMFRHYYEDDETLRTTWLKAMEHAGSLENDIGGPRTFTMSISDFYKTRPEDECRDFDRDINSLLVSVIAHASGFLDKPISNPEDLAILQESNNRIVENVAFYCYADRVLFDTLYPVVSAITKHLGLGIEQNASITEEFEKKVKSELKKLNSEPMEVKVFL
ncbi:hypothetical protein FPQ18DRAFT_387996 [Pyronema domesticum]|nr:hypothetical protein FPQ18DRAFT_387996 [Pyronema domesticum]